MDVATTVDIGLFWRKIATAKYMPSTVEPPTATIPVFNYISFITAAVTIYDVVLYSLNCNFLFKQLSTE